MRTLDDFPDGFMEPQVILDDWAELTDSNGESMIVPADYMLDAIKDDPSLTLTDTLRGHYGARLSAPGYLDCTDWAVFADEQEAIDYILAAYYGDE